MPLPPRTLVSVQRLIPRFLNIQNPPPPPPPASGLYNGITGFTSLYTGIDGVATIIQRAMLSLPYFLEVIEKRGCILQACIVYWYCCLDDWNTMPAAADLPS